MKYFITYVLMILAKSDLISQDRFKINLNAPMHINDSLILSIPDVRVGLEDLYNFQLETNENVKKVLWFPTSSYSVLIQKETTLFGNLDYPQPISFIYFDPKNANIPSVTNIFFIEKGSFYISLPKIHNKLDVVVDSPINNEYRNLKKKLAHTYVQLERYDAIDSLINFEEKNKILTDYIIKNPNSYVALWQIIEDYSLYHDHIKYGYNLKLFSMEVKKSQLFKSFESKLTAENSTRVGKILPDIYFDDQYSLAKDNFKDYKLTLIEYWATSCGPCIKVMPKIVNLFNEFKDKGLNVISITDENTSDGMKFADQILKKNNAAWTNFFDINDNFKSVVNATGYPLQFLVDNNGKIITRVMGDFDEIKKVIIETLK